MTHCSRFVHARRRRGGMVGGLIACLVLVGILGWLGYAFVYQRDGRVSQGELITQTVARGSFDHIVLEQGEIESSRNIEVLCEVKSKSYSGVPILWVIDEGKRVKEGELLVELDSATIEQELREDRIQVITAQANVTSAEALVEQAKIARQEYLEGVFKTEEATLLSDIAIANQDLKIAQLALGSSTRLMAKGLVKSLQLDADRFAVENADTQVASKNAQLHVLQNLTRKKMLVQFDSDIEAAEAQLSAYQSNLLEEEQELEDSQTQLANCTITAPVDGIVVHANRYSGRGGSAEFVVEAGASVRERQAIIRLPDPTQMQINCKINESRITLIGEGMPVKIAIDAIPGMQLKGRVAKVNRYAEPSSFFSSSIKEYAVFIEILDPPEDIRTGMTAGVQIFVSQLDEALQIPIQGLYEHDNEMYTLVQRSPSSFETIKVKIGATNDTMATIDEGLSEGDSVVLNLREHLNLMDLPEVAGEDNSDMRDLRRPPGAVAETESGPAAAGGAEVPGGVGRPGGGGADRPAGGAGRPAGGGGRPGGGPGRPGGGGGRGERGAARGPDGGPGGPGGLQGSGGPQGPGGPGGRRPGAGGGPEGAGGPGGERPGGPGGFGGGRPDVATMVRMSMQYDKDGDGKISAEEMNAVDPQWRGSLQAADADGDGSVTRKELTDSIQKRMADRP